MKKRLFVLSGVVALVIVLIIVSAQNDNKYIVYLLGSRSDVFHSETRTDDSLGAPLDVIQPEAAKNVLIAGETYEITYNSSLSTEMYVYTSADSRINSWYDHHTGYIRLISAESWLPDNSAAMTEEEYLDWIQAQVALFYTESWDSYKRSCATMVMTTADGAPQQQQRPGFVAAADGETVVSYIFTFTRILGDLETTDTIQAYINPGSGFAAIEFSAHRFDAETDISPDMQALDRAVKHFIRSNMDVSYRYIRHETGLQKLSRINGQLCMVTTVKIEVETEKETKTVSQELAIALN